MISFTTVHFVPTISPSISRTRPTPSARLLLRQVTSSLADFAAVTIDEVAKLISSALNKTCQLDPAPTWLAKDMSGLLSPFIALLINKSLTKAVSMWKSRQPSYGRC